MQASRGSWALGAWLCVGAAVMAGCAEAQKDQTSGIPATFTYGCCSDADVAQVVRPGDVLRLHWIVSAGGPPSSPSASPLPVTLSASLSGSYADVAGLKSSVGDSVPAPTYTAGPVQTTNQAGGAPVSTIAIPPDAAPGLYDLKSVVESSGATLTGDSIIRIESRATS